MKENHEGGGSGSVVEESGDAKRVAHALRAEVEEVEDDGFKV